MGRSSDARDRLLVAACELFHARGYRGVGVQELCDQAGVKKGSFYHFFPSKQDLAVAVLQRLWQTTRASQFEPAFAPDLPPLDRISRFFAGLARHLATSVNADGAICGCPFGNIAMEMSAQDPVLRDAVEAIYRGWARYFEGALREAQRSGELAEVDVETAAQSLVAFTSGLVLLAKTKNTTEIVERLAGRALALIGESRAVEVPLATVPTLAAP
jgi:TetR/AcrR family transcriptional repressor of nem operon